MAGPLADIYSASDTFKRKLIDTLRNPKAKLEQVLGDANDRARDWNEADNAALDEVMATGKLTGPKMMGQAMALGQGYNPAGITVWHGSPHGPFPKFDASKIGTGEGNQTFGRGHYAAEAKGVGEEYQRNLMGGNDMASQIAATNLKMYKTPERAIEALEDGLSPKLTKEATEMTKSAIDILRSGKANTGYLYKIDLPDEHVAKMVEWETPLAEQSDSLKAVIDPLHQELMRGPNPSLFKNARSVGDVIQYSNAVGLNPHEKLQAAGYPGIKYLDEGSRAAGKGTRNFVVFPGNEDMLKILEVNDQPIIEALRRKK